MGGEEDTLTVLMAHLVNDIALHPKVGSIAEDTLHVMKMFEYGRFVSGCMYTFIWMCLCEYVLKCNYKIGIILLSVMRDSSASTKLCQCTRYCTIFIYLYSKPDFSITAVKCRCILNSSASKKAYRIITLKVFIFTGVTGG